MREHPVAQKMAQARTGRAVADGAPAKPQPTFSPEQVTEAFVHHARLAAAHANWGTTFATADTLVSIPPDKQSMAALAQVTRILMKDRDRVEKKMADALVARIHTTVTAIFKDAQSDPEIEQRTEELVEERLRDGLGLSLTPDQRKQFAIDCKYIQTHGGPSDAAEDAIGAAFGLSTGSSIHYARKGARKRPLIPGPLNRWVPLRDVRQFMAKVLASVEEQRRATPILPLDALRSKAHAEGLMARVEGYFKEDFRGGIDAARAELVAACLSALRGEEPVFDQKLAPAAERAWLPLRAKLAELGALMTTQGSLATKQAAPDAPDTETLREFAEKTVDVLIAHLKEALDLG